VDQLRIAIIGDFDRGKHSHWATEAALFHAAAGLGVAVEPHWIGTPLLAREGAGDDAALSGCDAIWGAPGAPFASPQGMLRGIEHARTHDVPYLGTCAGFQYALIELSRNVLGVRDADSAENMPDASAVANIVITQVQCALPVHGKPRLDGEGVARPVAGTLLESLCGGEDLRGEFHCSLEANADFVPRWERAGLRIAARGAGGEMRAFELPAKRFFLATLFQPQLSSSYRRPHPIVSGFLRAASQSARRSAP
jgi:CTP synthase (UTP-ammonia lyase)